MCARVCTCVHVRACTHRPYVCGQRTTHRWSDFPPSTVWVLGIKFRLSGLAQAPVPTEPSCQPIWVLSSKWQFDDCLLRDLKQSVLEWTQISSREVCDMSLPGRQLWSPKGSKGLGYLTCHNGWETSCAPRKAFTCLRN